MVRQAHHERNQPFAVRPELVEGLIQSFPKLMDFGPVSGLASDAKTGIGRIAFPRESRSGSFDAL
jgi:hypothetical protein